MTLTPTSAMSLARLASWLLVTMIGVTGLGCASSPEPEMIWLNGSIYTMSDGRPRVEAVGVRDGRIVAAGDEAEVLALAGARTEIRDLRGRTMLPGFFDAHGHVQMIGLQATAANLLPPPDGRGANVEALLGLLDEWEERRADLVDELGWIIGFGYDESQLAERRHPTRRELDRVSQEHPVIIIHQSGHLGVVNSWALELAGITATTPDPPGGVFRREPGSREPTGVAEETAFFMVLGALASRFDDAFNDALVREGAALAASYGYTTAQEGRASPSGVEAMRRVAERGELPIDVVAYPDITVAPEIEPSRQYANRFRVGGAKLTIDGSPQGKTAWLTRPYFIPPEGRNADYRGYPAIAPEAAMAAVEKAFSRGWQILCHANGDAAIDLFIDAVREARARHPQARVRPVLIHGQTLRADQVEPLERLGIFPSLFPMHTFYWGDWHRESVLGPERAENISPTGWLLSRGMIFSTHHDAPVALPDSMRVLSATVSRVTRTGRVLGPEHRVPVETALKAMTIWPAWQHFEESQKGTIEVGKLADFVVLSADPLRAPEAELASIRVEETIKSGAVVYARDAAAERPAPPPLGLRPPLGIPHDAATHSDGCLNPAIDALLNPQRPATEGRLRD